MARATTSGTKVAMPDAFVLVREPAKGLEPTPPVSMRSSSDYFVQSCCGPLTCVVGTIGDPATSFEYRISVRESGIPITVSRNSPSTNVRPST